ncbi:BQ2448_1780 [Microbotryum intermedium]|uniref:BQ2448_1780 protein n=1 Tax=Microbotryum intermedium TaxID=269621 RepID=A0A238FH60_9BASI|nr:BQ2448_1780 [Microbotryum intermedium]
MSSSEQTSATTHQRRCLSELGATHPPAIAPATTRTTAAHPPNLATSTNTIEQTVVLTLKQRFVDLAYNADDVTAATAAHLLSPRQSSFTPTSELGALCDLAMNNNIEMSNELLSKILCLVESTEDNPGPGELEQIFYVRSWSLTIKELPRIVAFQCLIYIQYVGTTRGKSAYRPMIEDKARRKTGLIGEFLMALRTEAPQAFDAAAAFEVLRNTRLPESASNEERDLGERLLIAFFGRDNLLNVQSGGFYGQYVPSEDDFKFFETHHSSFFEMFAQHSAPVDAEKLDALEDWPAVVEAAIDEWPEATGTTTLVMPPNTLETLYLKPSPARTSMLPGKSRSGYLMADFAAPHARHEKGERQWDFKRLDRSSTPFLDLYPWPSKEELDLALAQIHLYIGPVNPVVTVTFGRETLSCARANFLHGHGLPDSASVFSHVGRVMRRYLLDAVWLEDASSSTPPPDRETLVIGHVDHGFDKYGSQPIELRRVVDVCWRVTFFVAGLVVEEAKSLAEQSPEGRPPPPLAPHRQHLQPPWRVDRIQGY